MATLDAAIQSLRAALDDSGSPHWRWQLRRHLSLVREALAQEPARSSDGWLAARSRRHERDRHQLVARLAALGPRVLDRGEADFAAEVRRLVADLERFQQRHNDLLYDSVSFELGGSE